MLSRYVYTKKLQKRLRNDFKALYGDFKYKSPKIFDKKYIAVYTEHRKQRFLQENQRRFYSPYRSFCTRFC